MTVREDVQKNDSQIAWLLSFLDDYASYTRYQIYCLTLKPRLNTYSVVFVSPLFIHESITLRLSDGNEWIGSDRCSLSDSIFSFSVFLTISIFSGVFSTTEPITVDSDDGILDVGCNEVALSLLELPVIVDDSANDDDDWDCARCWISTDSINEDKDVWISIDSVIDVFSSSFEFCSVANPSDCDSEEI